MAQDITTYYADDHDRLDACFESFRKLKRTDYAKAKEYFREFKFGLQRHIIWEEDILFPLFEEKTGMKNAGPTFVMRMEHRQIGAALEALHQKVRAQDPESDAEEAAVLALLQPHNDKEEMILYPAIDRAASDADRKDVFARMESVPEERYHTCCGGHHHA